MARARRSAHPQPQQQGAHHVVSLAALGALFALEATAGAARRPRGVWRAVAHAVIVVIVVVVVLIHLVLADGLRGGHVGLLPRRAVGVPHLRRDVVLAGGGQQRQVQARQLQVAVRVHNGQRRAVCGAGWRRGAGGG